MDDYKTLLKKARSQLPESVLKTERFVIPKIKGHIQGNKTILSNFFQIADFIDRDHDQFLKFILKELATPAEVKKPLLLLGRKISASQINQKIDVYAKKYVECKQCGKFDTKLVKQGKVKMLSCQVCGAKYPVT